MEVSSHRNDEVLYKIVVRLMLGKMTKFSGLVVCSQKREKL